MAYRLSVISSSALISSTLLLLMLCLIITPVVVTVVICLFLCFVVVVFVFLLPSTVVTNFAIIHVIRYSDVVFAVIVVDGVFFVCLFVCFVLFWFGLGFFGGEGGLAFFVCLFCFALFCFVALPVITTRLQYLDEQPLRLLTRTSPATSDRGRITLAMTW